MDEISMVIEEIRTAIFSCIGMTVTISVLIYGFNSLGRLLFRLLGLPVGGGSIAIAAGMAATSFFGWYAYRLNVPLSSFITITFFTVMIVFIINAGRHLTSLFREDKIIFNLFSSAIYVVPIFALAFSVQALLAFKSSTIPIGTLGNNDIFSWALTADKLLGSVGYGNVYPAGSGAAESLAIDAWGTPFILALVSKFIEKTAIEATPSFTIFCLTLIGFSTFELVKNSFNLKNQVAFAVALLTTGGSFLFYIAYNNFYAQLLATFFYITMMQAIVRCGDLEKRDIFIKKCVLLLFPAIGLLIVYQSGFLVFATFSIVFSIVYGLSEHLNTRSFAVAVGGAKQFSLPLLCAVLLTLMMLPELTMHTVHRTIMAKDIIAGWSLPLISPYYLLSIPILTAFPGSTAHPAAYILLFVCIFSVLVSVRIVHKRRNEKIAPGVITFSLFYCLSLVVYVLAYLAKGEIYQVWKMAAFVVLPVSFVFNAMVLVALDRTKVADSLVGKIFLSAVVCGGIVFLGISLTRLNMSPLSHKFAEFQAIKSVLQGEKIENVILSTEPYGETMLAFTVLSNDFKLFPLAQTYIAPAEISLIKQLDPAKTRMLVRAKCYSNIDEGYKITKLDAVPEKIFFSVDGAHCARYSGVQLMEGFSGAEPWGTWSDGYRAQLVANIPSSMIDKDVYVSFEVAPFGEQAISVSANGYLSGSYVVKEKMILKIFVPATRTKQGIINFVFSIDRPRRPKDVDPASDDPRLLGLGFLSLSIKDHE